MRYITILLIFSWNTMAFCQNTINEKIAQASFDNSLDSQPLKRKLLSFKKKQGRYNPLSYASAGLLYVYQNVISEQIQAQCTYEISCSEYTKVSIQKFGLFIGILKGFNQLSDCFNGARYEHPRLYIDNNNKIINRFENEIK